MTSKYIEKINLDYNIDQIIINLDSGISKCKCKLIELFQKGLEKEIKRGKYKVEMNVIFNISFFDRIKLKINNIFPRINKEKLLFRFYFHIEDFLDMKLEAFKKEFTNNFTRMRVNISRMCKDMVNNTKNNFEELLLLSCCDLGQIEKENWEELKNTYKEIKRELIKLSIESKNEY